MCGHITNYKEHTGITSEKPRSSFMLGYAKHNLRINSEIELKSLRI